MIFRTVIQDCLWLNWAVPEEALPPPPRPLTYDVCRTREGGFVFVSAMLFRQHGLGPGINLPGVSYPQCQLHACALDGDRLECAWVFSMLLPNWLATSVRWVAGRPARGARLDYPAAGDPGRLGERWSWSVKRGSRFEVEANLSSPPPGAGPSLGSWKETLAYFRRQRLEYVLVRGKWQRVEVDRRSADAVPVRAAVLDDALVTEHLMKEGSSLPPLHSSWLLPTVKTSFEYAGEGEHSALPEAPAPL
ncbi:MAG: hypothetical protein GY769_17540 [bacterium]|nr:hypothetical protein [bacterium]